VVLAGKEILGGCRTMDAGHQGYGKACHMQGHGDPIFFCIIAYSLCLQQSAGRSNIGVDYVDRTFVN
jgi:hypothetical protein